MRSTLKLAFVALLTVLMSACAHQLEIRNLSSYNNNALAPLPEKLTVGIVSGTNDIHAERLVKGIGSEMGKYSADVILPYSFNNARPVDVIASVSVNSEYKGSGWNFLVNFPGFLVWAPAWNGYVYKVNYDVSVVLTDAQTKQQFASFEVPVHLDIRHADTNRTWTELSWLEVGAIALVSGVVFTQYDNTVTPLVAQSIQSPVGDYLAQEIVSRINAYGPPRATAAEPVASK